MIRKAASPRAGKVLVTFEIPASLWATQVHLIGDFNKWDWTAHPLTQRRSDSAWVITLELDAGQAYQFRYLSDGQRWCNDCQADGYAPNPYGGDNSVVVASLPPTDDASDEQ
ncbi:MAG: isoamylase early set domain-containing protein [Anaerolineae bacterium]